MKPRILLIEDDSQIRKFLRASLTLHDFELLEAETGKEGLLLATTQPPDVVILDLGLGDMDGIEVAQRIRTWSRMPIIVLSARGRETDKVAALDAGADDFVSKPFGVSELLARIRVALRHNQQINSPQGSAVFCCDQLRVDLAKRQVFLCDRELHLTPIEYRLLALLVKHSGKVITHQQLLTEVWGPRYATEVQYLRVYMAQLRRKIEEDPAQPRYITTEQGVGYRLVDEF